jgi:hypothetical protein
MGEAQAWRSCSFVLEGGEVMKLDLDKVKVVKARCEGRGYFLRAPREPWDWDVDTIRVECLGCPDCKPKKQKEKVNP